MFRVTCLICNSIKTLTNTNSSKKTILCVFCKKNAWIWKVVLQWNCCLRLIFVLSYKEFIYSYLHDFCHDFIWKLNIFTETNFCMKSIHHPNLIIYSPFTFEKETTKHFFFWSCNVKKKVRMRLNINTSCQKYKSEKSLMTNAFYVKNKCL